MSTRSEALAVWSGPVMVAFLTAGFLIGGVVPPPDPGADAAGIVDFYADDLTRLRIGVMLIAVGATFFIPFGAAIAAQIRRIEGPGSPMAATQVAAACVTTTLTTAYTMFMLSAAFRLERPEEITLAINDLAWLPFVAVFMPGALQAASLAVAVLGDRAAPPVLPRWVGWFSLWMAFTSLAGSLVPFFRSGPFSWDGGIAFYLAATVFFSWFVVVFFVVRRRVAEAAAEGAGR